MVRNIKIYPWFKFLQSLSFWQATWFLYFESVLSAADAILLYAVYDLATTILEIPSGYMSDRLGRRPTLLASGVSILLAVALFYVGDSFVVFALASVMLGAGAAFASGTDSSILFESLKAEGRTDEVEQAELKAWRFGFVALAISALSGGAMALFDATYPYLATLIAAAATLALTCVFREPPHTVQTSHKQNLQAIGASLRQRILVWLLALSLLMYVFSHIPYVMGQPFIREALQAAGYAAQTPLISGGVTFTMMIVSVAVSIVALKVRDKLGLANTLLLAFGMQILLITALALSNNLFVVALLFFRMVPDSLSQPFIRARAHTLLPDGIRATYLSIQSLAGRVLFALTLMVAAMQTTGDAPLPYQDMQIILTAYVALGVAFWLALLLTARRARV